MPNLQLYRCALIGKFLSPILGVYFLHVSFISSFLAIQVPINKDNGTHGAYYSVLIMVTEVLQNSAANTETGSMNLGIEDDIDLFYTPYCHVNHNGNNVAKSIFAVASNDSSFFSVYLETLSPPPRLSQA